MSLVSAIALRDRLKNDAPLNAYFAAHYKAARYFVGYKKAQNAADLPAISIVPAEGMLDVVQAGERIVSVVISISDTGVVDDVFSGVSRLADIEDLALAALIPLELTPGTIWTGKARPVYEHRHPFYDVELMLSIREDKLY